MSNTTENYVNKANLTPVINKIEGKLNNRYTKGEVDDLLEEHSGGHTIENASGTALTQRDTLQFKGGLSASDDSTNAVTVVDDTVPEIEWSVWNAMTPQEQEAIPNAILLNAPGGGGDTSALANKSDITDLQLTGTTNSTGSTITSGTWFYLNGVLVKAKADIANGATFTENTNYEVKTVGDELSELNSNKLPKLYHYGTSFKDAFNDTSQMGLANNLDILDSNISNYTNGQPLNIGNGSSQFQGILFKFSDIYYTAFICGYATYGAMYIATRDNSNYSAFIVSPMHTSI